MDGIKSFKEIMLALKRKLFLILLVSLGAGVVSGLYTYYTVTPLYEASSQFLVNKKTVADGQGKVMDVSELDIKSNLEVINTYSVILKNPVILQEVVDKLNLTLTPEQLSTRLQVAISDSSQVVTLIATDVNPERAAEIANTTIQTFKEKLPQLMQVDNISILNEAKSNNNPVSPNIKVNVAMAIALGAIVGIGLVLLFEFLDTTIRSKEDIERLDIEVIGVISSVVEKDRLPQSFIQSLEERGTVYAASTAK